MMGSDWPRCGRRLLVDSPSLPLLLALALLLPLQLLLWLLALPLSLLMRRDLRVCALSFPFVRAASAACSILVARASGLTD
jgi:hypothetical protein